MTANGETNGDEAFLSIETLAIAGAIAERSAKDEVLFGKILAELSGEPYEEKSTEELRSAKMGRTVLLMARIDDPSIPISLRESVDASMGEEGYKAQAERLSEIDDELGELRVETEGVKNFYQNLAAELEETSGITADYTAELFERGLRSAREVAEEHDVTVTDVYSDDELFYESQRKAFSPDEFADMTSKLSEAMSEEMINKAMLQVLDTMIPASLRDLLGPEELNEISLEMQLDENLQASFGELIETSHEAIRQYFVGKARTIWGPQALDELSDEHQQSLLPRQPLTPAALEAAL